MFKINDGVRRRDVKFSDVLNVIILPFFGRKNIATIDFVSAIRLNESSTHSFRMDFGVGCVQTMDTFRRNTWRTSL